MTRLVQISDGSMRRVALVDEPDLRLLSGADSVYEMARAALRSGDTLSDLIQARVGDERLGYDDVHGGASRWKLLVPIDHPGEPARCIVSGTGLTHLGSAQDRQAMHEDEEASPTDSMRMFRMGVEGGRPAPGGIGAAPEWFYKGTGGILRSHGEELDVPSYAEDGGEEAEVAGLYVIADDGQPWRVGMATGNEFSDHEFEKRNYLNLAGAKLRNCSLGPELVVDHPFQSVPGTVTIERSGSVLWTKPIATGELEMCHSLANIEHHHFKFPGHRHPGDVHVHYLGAHSLSFGAGLRLQDGDVMVIEFDGFGRPLRNQLRRRLLSDPLLTVRAFS